MRATRQGEMEQEILWRHRVGLGVFRDAVADGLVTDRVATDALPLIVPVNEENQQLADRPLPEERLWLRLVDLHAVVVTAAGFGLADVSGFHQVGDDAVRGSLGDADRAGDLPQADAWIVCDAQECLSVVCQETPSHEAEHTGSCLLVSQNKRTFDVEVAPRVSRTACCRTHAGIHLQERLPP
jgi:hypothetical protein